NIEREKYRFTESVEILNYWSGISVVDGLSAVNIPFIVDAIAIVGADNISIDMRLHLKADISKSEVRALLENDDHFNTYLESIFTI
ncbi:hypothetical protein, partial [Opacimonas viscosa]